MSSSRHLSPSPALSMLFSPLSQPFLILCLNNRCADSTAATMGIQRLSQAIAQLDQDGDRLWMARLLQSIGQWICLWNFVVIYFISEASSVGSPRRRSCWHILTIDPVVDVVCPENQLKPSKLKEKQTESLLLTKYCVRASLDHLSLSHRFHRQWIWVKLTYRGMKQIKINRKPRKMDAKSFNGQQNKSRTWEP